VVSKFVGFHLVQAAALVIDCELGYVWSNLVVRYNAHPFFFGQHFKPQLETSDVSTQTMPLLPSDNKEPLARDLITKVPWDSHAIVAATPLQCRYTG